MTGSLANLCPPLRDLLSQDSLRADGGAQRAGEQGESRKRLVVLMETPHHSCSILAYPPFSSLIASVAYCVTDRHRDATPP